MGRIRTKKNERPDEHTLLPAGRARLEIDRRRIPTTHMPEQLGHYSPVWYLLAAAASGIGVGSNQKEEAGRNVARKLGR